MSEAYWDSLPQQWEILPLGEICALVTDGSHFSPQPQSAGRIIANVKDMRGGYIDLQTCTRISERDFQNLKANNCVPQKDDVLFSKDGTIGRVIVYEQQQEIAVLSSIAILRPGGQINSRFLGHVLQSNHFARQIDAFKSGSALRRLVLRDITCLVIPFPSLPEQRRIAAILDAADAAIRAGERIIAKLRQVKAGLLHDLLTLGVDARGRLRDPHLHPEQFKDSPLGRIPREWEVALVKEVAKEVVTGTTPSTSRPEYYGGNIPFVSPSDFNDDLFIRKTERTLSEEGVKQARLLPKDTIMVTCIGILGKVGRAEVPLATNQQINSLIPNEQLLDPMFGLWAAHLLEHQLQIVAGLQVVPIVNKSGFSRLLLPLPPLAEQTRIAAILDAHDARLRAEEAAVAKLRQVKAGLMEDLLTGKVRSQAL